MDDRRADERTPTIRAIEAWFVAHGVPSFIETDTEGSALDVWTRALPLLTAAYLLLCLNAIDVREWSLLENLAGAVIGIGIGIGAWALSNRVRRRPVFARPRDIDAPELAVFLIGPALAALAFGQRRDALESIVLAIALLAAIYAWSAYGLGPLLRWGVRAGFGQLSHLTTLLAKALPLLLIFNTFLFINAEVWELAGNLDGVVYPMVIGAFFLLAAVFAVSRVPQYVAELNEFAGWDEVAQRVAGTPASDVELPDRGSPAAPLPLGARLNIGMMVLFGQAVQILLVVAGLTTLFVLFGLFTMEAGTIERWTGNADVDSIATGTLGGRDLLLTEPLLRVSVFLGAFSGMYFTVLLTTDATYREEIADLVEPEIRRALAVRTAYRVERDRSDRGRGPERARSPMSSEEAAGRRHAHGADAEPPAATGGATIRELTGAADMHQAVDLLKQVWGSSTELVRLEMLMAISHAGGYVTGAFRDGDGAMVGTSVAILARYRDRPALHSHVTGLLPDARHAGLGRAMKLHQRSWAAARDLEWIVWTFDPLVRRNAWFNIGVLGVEVHGYLESFYGEMTDAINAGDESDRLLVAWHVPTAGAGHGRDGSGVAGGRRVPTPDDVVALRRTDPAEVARWRARTRDELSSALAAGQQVLGFTRTGEYVIGDPAVIGRATVGGAAPGDPGGAA